MDYIGRPPRLPPFPPQNGVRSSVAHPRLLTEHWGRWYLEISDRISLKWNTQAGRGGAQQQCAPQTLHRLWGHDEWSFMEGCFDDFEGLYKLFGASWRPLVLDGGPIRLMVALEALTNQHLIRIPNIWMGGFVVALCNQGLSK